VGERGLIGLAREPVTVTNASNGPIYHAIVTSEGRFTSDLNQEGTVELLRPGQSQV
jgi:hypothetical protein